MDDRGMRLPSTIGETLSRRAATDPQSPALVCSGLEAMTFAGLDRQVRLLGEQLRRTGIGSDSRVGIALPRGPEAALLSVAVSCTATVLPINPTLSADELEEELRRIRVDALIVPGWEAVPAWASQSNPAFGLFQVSKAAASLDEVVLKQLRPIARRPLRGGAVNAQSVCAIFRTSGTTGLAKRVPVTHENLIEMARKMERWLRLGPADRSACVMPIYYNAGFKATLVVPLLIGCSVALPMSSGPQDFRQWVSELEPTWLTAAPTFLQALLDKLPARPDGGPGHSLRFILSTASYLPESVRTELQARAGVPVLEFYGLCEAGMMTAPRLPPAAPKPGTVGAPPPGEFEIRGDDGKPLGPGKVGQIMLRGPSVMPGYLQDIDDTPAGLVDGWLATGDLGSVDSEGDLTVVGRTKEIINRGGEKISPYDVEKVLLRHPAVREAAVFAVPHPRLGESVAAAVVLNDGAAATSSALIEFLHDRLAPFQMPRQVHILGSLPKGATGKISRALLSSTYGEQPRDSVRPDEPLQIQIAEIWQRILKRDDIGIDEDFFDAGGDSLQATEMLLELEAQTRQTIAPSEIKAELTIRHLVETLVSAVASRDEFVSKVRDGIGRPLFMCHGDFDGWGFYALRLADLLEHDGPIYLLHPNFDRAAGVDTIEGMAGRYIPQLLALQPDGAFQLAGYCHGGLAAWEIAHQLERAGRKVESLLLIDTFSINARPAVRGIARAVNVLGGLAPGNIGDKLRAKGMPAVWAGTRRLMQKDRAILWRVARRLYGGTPGAANSLRSDYYRAMSNYLPPPIKARVTVVLSDEYTRKKEFAAEAWKALAPQVGQEHVPGKHNTCITSHVGELAQAMNRHLTAA
jgi:acyl-CoA synthetase (AMP-forming)/AMP-acid ligase II/thioesterase domain-containing protein/acyl carrier protein